MRLDGVVPKRSASKSRGSKERHHSSGSEIAQASLTDQLYRNYIWLKFKLRHEEETLVNEQGAIHVKTEVAPPPTKPEMSDYAVNDIWQPNRNAVTPDVGAGVR